MSCASDTDHMLDARVNDNLNFKGGINGYSRELEESI